MKPAVGLIRVSTNKQAEGSDSPQVQEDRIRQWAQLSDHEIVAIYGQHDEGSSGYIPAMEREDARQAIEHAMSLKAPLVCYSLSRLGRNRIDLMTLGERLLKRGANLIGISDGLNLALLYQSAMGKAMFGMQAVFAQWYRDEVSEKTCNHLRDRKANGRRAGSVPYGWMVDPTKTRTRKRGDTLETYHSDLIENPAEQPTLAEINRLAAEDWTAGEIARKLNKDKQFARSGKPWDPAVIWRILNPDRRRK